MKSPIIYSAEESFQAGSKIEAASVHSENNDNEHHNLSLLRSLSRNSYPIDRIATDHSLAIPTDEYNKPSTNDDNGDIIIVDWDGPEDPENPRNWPKAKKVRNIILMAAMTFITPFASSAYAPALPELERQFKTSATLTGFSVSIFVLAFGIGPMTLAPLGETFGRRPIYIIGYGTFSLLNIACAKAKSIEMLIVFRFLSGFFGSAGISNGGGSISDMYTNIERTRVVGWYIIGPLAGPSLGPIVGGLVTQYLSWNWVFYIILIISGINTFLGFIFLKESYAPVLLARKAKAMEKELGKPCLPVMHDPRSLPRRLISAIQRPIRILITQPVVFGIAVYMALIYGTLYLMFTTFPTVFEYRYGFQPAVVGLVYLGCGVGFLISIIFGVRAIDKTYRRLTEKNGGVSKPEYRLPVANLGVVLIPISLFWYGWCVQAKVHYMVTIIGTIPFGMGQILIFQSSQNYFIDCYSRYAASSIAAGATFRAVVGSTFPLFGPKMFEKLGYGWGFTMLGLLAVLLIPGPFILWRYGERIREKYPMSFNF